MADCALTTGFDLDCKKGVGGVQTIILTDWANVTAAGAVTFDTEEIVTALTLTSADLFVYNLPPQTANFEETIAVNEDNGTVVYTQTINFNMHILDSEKRKELQEAAKMRLAVFVLDAMNNWFLVGYERSANFTTSTGATGAKLGDLNGYTNAIVAMSNKRAYFCDDSPLEL